MKKYKTSDIIAERIKKEVDTVFGVTGGCVVNLMDSLHKKKVRIIQAHHEQAASICADAYARFKGFGVCLATSGPGVTNLITGTCCSYFDSIPVLTIGGQVNSKHLNKGKDRQMGFQEVDGVNLFKPITKYSKLMKDIKDLENAIEIAKEGRQGPTYLEICDDFQRIMVSDKIKSKKIKPNKSFMNRIPKKDLDKLKRLCKNSKRPVIIFGKGIRNLPSEMQIPSFGTWGLKEYGFDLHDFGITGNPQSNDMIKKADLVILIGTRMDTHQCPNWKEFAPNGKKIAIGFNFPHKVNLKIDIDLKDINNEFFKLIKDSVSLNEEWIKEYNLLTRFKNNTPAYKFIRELNNLSKGDEVIIPDMGQIGCIAFQTWRLKANQRLFNGVNHSPMGYSIPASIGASLGSNKPVIVIIGDGSLMMTMQSLQTIKDLGLNIKIFVVNNNGYGMIKQTQNDWKQYLDQGVACQFKIPNIKKLAEAFGIKYVDYKKAFNYSVPVISEIKLKDTTICPKWKWGTKL